MSSPRFYTDEDIHAAVAIELRRAGFDAISTPEAGRISLNDEAQLAWAAAEGRTIITFNVGDFAALHAIWIHDGKSHAGIIVSSQRTIGDMLRRLKSVANHFDRDAIKDRIIYLGDW